MSDKAIIKKEIDGSAEVLAAERNQWRLAAKSATAVAEAVASENGSLKARIAELETKRDDDADLIDALEKTVKMADSGFVNASRREDELEARDELRAALENIKQNMANDRFVDPIQRKMYLGAIAAVLAGHPAGPTPLQQLEAIARQHGGVEIIPLADGNVELQGDDLAALGVGATLAEALGHRGGPSDTARLLDEEPADV